MLDQFALLLRSGMIVAGFVGFLIGLGLGIWRDLPLVTSLLRGSMLCLACAFLVRVLLLKLFRAHIEQLQLRKQNEEKAQK